ncbi:hypothetical protein F2Q69_00035436 [Brassica cretica]|uniref:RNase H type-1 domain-containing protein n=1 Tax=Brassica cretica TaxID=69181 RepID=A0A8S9SPW8_BRACR|nr:hypothetical protein F2Q69_00035436 [Brassica cretica]
MDLGQLLIDLVDVDESGWIVGENIQLMGTRNFTRYESSLHSEVEALRWAMKNLLQHWPCQSFGTDCKELIAMIKEPHEWPSFATELKKIETLQICFADFKITHVPRVCNQFSDFLAKTVRTFRRELLFIGCSIPSMSHSRREQPGRDRGNPVSIAEEEEVGLGLASAPVSLEGERIGVF